MLYDFRRELTLDLLGEDHIVLGRLVYTLGIIMYAATNAPVSLIFTCSQQLLNFSGYVRIMDKPRYAWGWGGGGGGGGGGEIFNPFKNKSKNPHT